MESVLVAGFAAAFVLSVMDYWVEGPLLRAVAGAVAALLSLLLLGVWGPSLAPSALAATFVGALGFNVASRVGDLRPTAARR